jgi:hypothetical protein
MSKARVKVLYHVGVDHDKVNDLVKQHGGELMEAVGVNLARGGPAEAIFVDDDIHLYVRTDS